MEIQKTETQSNGVTEKHRLRDSEIGKWKDGETHRQRERRRVRMAKRVKDIIAEIR